MYQKELEAASRLAKDALRITEWFRGCRVSSGPGIPESGGRNRMDGTGQSIFVWVH